MTYLVTALLALAICRSEIATPDPRIDAEQAQRDELVANGWAFARGEITQAEYSRRAKEIRRHWDRYRPGL